MDDRYTFARDGRLYHADRQTVEVLRAVEEWDQGSTQNLAHEIFTRGLANGRIGEGPVHTLEQQTVPGLTETVDIDGVRFATTPAVARDLDEHHHRLAYEDVDIADHGERHYPTETAEMRQAYNQLIDHHVGTGELRFVERVPHQQFRANGDDRTPVFREVAESLERTANRPTKAQMPSQGFVL